MFYLVLLFASHCLKYVIKVYKKVKDMQLVRMSYKKLINKQRKVRRLNELGCVV